MKFLIINGPNLNMLGKREPHIYGHLTLEDLENLIKEKFPHYQFEFFQSNHEGGIIDTIHNSLNQDIKGIIINAGAFTHTSLAIADALSSVKHPKIEVHISNVHARESFRHHSYMAPLCKAVISGLGFHGYIAAIEYLAEL